MLDANAQALPEIHTESCTVAMLKGGNPVGTFNKEDPNGHYKLDLSDSHDWNVARDLVRPPRGGGPTPMI